MILDYEIAKCPEHEVKSKIGTIFVKYKNECEYLLFKIDIYFTEYVLAVEIDEKSHTDRDPLFEEKRQKALEKNLSCKFIRINTSQKNYDADYEASRIHTFISNFKENKNKIKELEDEIKKLKLQLTNQSVQNNDDNDDNDDNDKK